MSATTTDPEDPNLGKHEANGQQRAYLVLSDDERARGFVQPVRTTYVHLTCRSHTTMAMAIAETYARDPAFYSGTFCVTCRKHLPLSEFRWVENGKETDLVVGSVEAT